MKHVNSYLKKLNEVQFLEEQYANALEEYKKVDQLTEQGVGRALITVAKVLGPSLISLFLGYLYFLYKSKKDVYLEEKLKIILRDIGEDFGAKIITVREFGMKDPNAFCAVGRALFYTSGLKKLLTEKEIIAVLLHEYRHFKSLDAYTNFASRFGMMLLIAKIFPSTVRASLLIPWLALYFFVLILTTGVPYKLTLGRLAEYRADSFPAKYGYAEDLISALNKLTDYYKVNKPTSFLFAVLGKIDRILVDEHPALSRRVENILKTKELYEGNVPSRVSAIKTAVKENLGEEE